MKIQDFGPMFVSGIFRFLNGQIEGFMGRALAAALKRQKKARKAARSVEDKMQAEVLRQERKAARRARRAEKEARKQAAMAANDANTEETFTKEKENGLIDVMKLVTDKDYIKEIEYEQD